MIQNCHRCPETSHAGTSGAAATLAWARVENAACARRLAGMVTMLDALHAADGSANRDQWCLDNWGAACAEIGASQQLTPGVASHLLLIGTALRDRLPTISALFHDGLIGYRLIATIVRRTGLIKDPDALRAVDTELAAMVQGWGAMSMDKTDQAIDALIATHDPYALRRTQEKARGRAVDVFVDDDSGMATLWATLFATDAAAFDQRLDAMASTLCAHDPRTRDQRRSDAMGAIGHGQDRLICLCGRDDCLGATSVPSTVVVYVVANADSVAPPTPAACPDQPDGGATPADPPTAETDDAEADDTDADADADAEAEAEENDADADTTETSIAASDDARHESDRVAADAAAQHASLDGESPPMFSKPLREMTLAEVYAECNADPGEPLATPPGVIIGGPLLPGPVVARAALHAKIVPVVHPGNAPPELRYTPSRKLADFVRCRDLTCRFPHCTVPANRCDVDHTIAHPLGPTSASNLKCLCRFHHLLKTFWGGPCGWRDQQLPDGDVIWTSPSGQTYTTQPGSRLLFPSLSLPTAPVTVTDTPTAHTAGLTMPRRKTTRAQDRQYRIDDERRRNEAENAAAALDAQPPF
ncbi:DUF222 domain-containing protein [Mycobacterium sp. URHB0044]|uniref:HNH endonuclease signature motif containing protein n=1 Tax=Mycobacterium sp. URHB0044 TaxID=1380386 RepID=UPI003510792A